MKKATKRIAVSLLMSAMIGASSAQAAAWSKDALRGENGQPLTEMTTLAGNGGLGSADGAGASASFRMPGGLTVLKDGTVLVSDSRNQLIRKLSQGIVSTFAGAAYKQDGKGFPVGDLLDGKSDASLFNEPQGLATDANDNVYVADSGNHAIRKIDTAGQVSTVAGSGLLGRKDGKGKDALFYRPTDVVVAADGTLYVADSLNHAIRSISPSGEVKTLNALSSRVVELFPGQVSPAGDFADGDLKSAKFNEPTALVLDAKGNLIVSDSGNQRIRYIDLQTGKVTTLAGGGQAAANKELHVSGGFADGSASDARFNFPMGLALTEEGGLVIADSQNHAIRYLLDGQVSTIAGASDRTTGNVDGIEGSAALHRPMDIGVRADGSILVADTYNNKLREVSLYRLPDGLPKDGAVKVVVDRKQIAFEAQPEIVNGRTMVPIRAITQALDYKVTFDNAARAVQLVKDGETIELYIGKTGIKRSVPGQEATVKPTDVEPYISQNLTFVPVRFFAEEIGMDVQWDEATRTAIVRSKTKLSK
ncbi:stalk domain-containing protein [Paenibacillus tyrfis]|uniref:Copper amine oxidase n=1 Tax=Paenibacillus tyrfis TaxID=1501230 RepID=A0A081P6E4_9BACL|nr:stalk domain-containing protein [Paenibacillus tyrfis]KEQ26267.1 copper amine oxidase [Paenibacillus tyrfis]